MNEQIEKLSDEAYLFAQSQHSIYSPELLRTYTKQFAELIVKECAEVADNADATRSKWESVGKYVREHFGVE